MLTKGLSISKNLSSRLTMLCVYLFVVFHSNAMLTMH